MYKEPRERLILDTRYLDIKPDFCPEVKLKIPLADNPPLAILHIDAGIHRIDLSNNNIQQIEYFIRKTKTLTHLYLGRIDHVPQSGNVVFSANTIIYDRCGSLTCAIEKNTSLIHISIHVELLQYPFLIDSIIASQSIREVRIFDDNHKTLAGQVEAVLYRLIREKKNMTSLHLDARRQFSCTKFIGALADNTTLMELALPRCELTYQDIKYLTSVLEKNNHLKSLTITSGYTGKELVLDMLKKNKSLLHVELYGDHRDEKFSKILSLYKEVDSFLRRNRLTSLLHSWMMINLLKADKGVICAAGLISVYSHMLANNMRFCNTKDNNQMVVDLLWMRNLNERFICDFPGIPKKGRPQEKVRLQDFSLLGHSLFQVPANNAAEAFKSMLVEKKAIPCIRNYLSERSGHEHGGITRAGSLLQVLCSPDVTLNCKLLVLDALISTGVGTIGVDKGTDLVKDLRKCFKSSSESKCIKDTAQIYAKDNQLDLLQAERMIIKKINGLLACEQITDAYLLQQKSFWSLTFG